MYDFSMKIRTELLIAFFSLSWTFVELQIHWLFFSQEDFGMTAPTAPWAFNVFLLFKAPI